MTTNSVESYFTTLKRGLIGTYHHVAREHLHRYTNEFYFRHNFRQKAGYNDSEPAVTALKGIGGKRLTYRQINKAA